MLKSGNSFRLSESAEAEKAIFTITQERLAFQICSSDVEGFIFYL